LIYAVYETFAEREKILDLPYSLFFYEVVMRFERQQAEISEAKEKLKKARKNIYSNNEGTDVRF